MIKNITNFLIIFFIFQQLKSQISQIEKNGYNAFCNETLHIYITTLNFLKAVDGMSFMTHHSLKWNRIELLLFLHNYIQYHKLVQYMMTGLEPAPDRLQTWRVCVVNFDGSQGHDLYWITSSLAQQGAMAILTFLLLTVHLCRHVGGLWARSYVLGTQPRQNVLGTCSRYTSVHITSTVKCSRYPFVQVENGTHLGLRSMTYCVHIHCATCEVILMCTLRSYLFCFGCVLKGAICSENMVWPCSSWNCSSGNNSL